MSGKFGSRSTAEQVSEGIDLSGRHAVVTGANTGIGLEAARVMALRGAEVTLACRDLEQGETARQRIAAESGGTAHLLELDLADLGQVRRAATALLETGRPIHLLVNNAGVMLPDRRETLDGFEAHFGINHLGHFLFTTLLLDRIRESAPARIVNVSSDALHFASLTPELADLDWKERKFSGWRSYGDSKLMNVIFTRELTRRLEADGVTAYALHPGMVRTQLGRYQGLGMKAIGLLILPLTKSAEQGAATTVYTATSPDVAPGGYYSNCAPGRDHKLFADAALAAKLWERSEYLAKTASAEGARSEP